MEFGLSSFEIGNWKLEIGNAPKVFECHIEIEMEMEVARHASSVA